MSEPVPQIEDQDGLIKYLEEQIKEKRLSNEFVASPVWDTFKMVLERAIGLIVVNMSNPVVPNEGFERGRLSAFNEMKRWAKKIGEKIKLLQLDLDDAMEGKKKDGGTK